MTSSPDAPQSTRERSWTVAELARQLDGQVEGDSSLVLRGFAPADAAGEGQLTFAESDAFFRQAEQSAARAILVAAPFHSARKTLIRVANVRVAAAKVLALYHPEPVYRGEVHVTSVVDPTARVDASAYVGPLCVVEAGAVLGPRSVLIASVFVGAGCVIGDDSRLFPHVTLYPRTEVGRRVRIHAGSVIGSDGYGYVFDAGVHHKIPQVGQVLIHDDVEIGANVTIDRGALGPTLIGRGTKIDNLVQIAHNVVLGEHCLLVSQVGIAGSTRLGNYVTLAGQVGITGHLQIGDRVVVAAQSGVMNSIPAGEKWLGSPARPDRKVKRQFLAIERLPDLLRRVSALEREHTAEGSSDPTAAGPAS